MIRLRPIEDRDLSSIERLAQIPGFINLSNDVDFLREKIAHSKRSFAGELDDPWESKFTFVAEDLSSGHVVGTSMVAAQHGTPEMPHFYFEVGSERKYSQTIGTGFIHGTLTLRYETEGPSEVGALVVDPGVRNRPERVGRQISFVRFLFIGLHRERFKDRLIAELLPPLNKKGQSPLWEAVGRRFTNMEYWEADLLCQKNKEFILSLFPTQPIYTTFLTAEARNAIGKVGKDTEPVMHMLTKLGFQYQNHVDPFDGGPHLQVKIADLKPVQAIQQGKLAWSDTPLDTLGLLTPTQAKAFVALQVTAHVAGDQVLAHVPEGKAALEQALGTRDGDVVAFMPYY